MKKEGEEAPETRESYLARITEIAARGDQQQLRELATELKLRWATDPTHFLEDLYGLAGGHAQVEFYQIFGEPGVPEGVPEDRLRLLGAMRAVVAEFADRSSLALYASEGKSLDTAAERNRVASYNLDVEIKRLQDRGQGV
ncbi:hypothetical protein FJZ40_05390 [Candidatus Shapirobacteria bacterium]|nr:hypothetical protein [Candidatus Shapirobacteria bacterium]